jgi:hypothetical protein
MYMIIRYHRTQRRKVIQTCVTLEDAQALCSNPATSDPKGQWFYGYTEQRYRVVSLSGRTVATNLSLQEAEALRFKGAMRSILPIDRF